MLRNIDKQRPVVAINKFVDPVRARRYAAAMHDLTRAFKPFIGSDKLPQITDVIQYEWGPEIPQVTKDQWYQLAAALQRFEIRKEETGDPNWKLPRNLQQNAYALLAMARFDRAVKPFVTLMGWPFGPLEVSDVERQRPLAEMDELQNALLKMGYWARGRRVMEVERAKNALALSREAHAATALARAGGEALYGAVRF